MIELRESLKHFENERNYLSSFHCEEQIVFHMRAQSYDTEEVLSMVESIGTKSNDRMKELIERNENKTALKLLNETAKLLREFDCQRLAKLQNLTYNNISLIYMKSCQYQKAWENINNALNVCLNHRIKDNLVVTYINFSTISRKLKKYKNAFDMATKAAFQCQEDLSRLRATHNPDQAKISTEVVHLALAYYNMGLNDEELDNHEAAIDWYRMGSVL